MFVSQWLACHVLAPSLGVSATPGENARAVGPLLTVVEEDHFHRSSWTAPLRAWTHSAVSKRRAQPSPTLPFRCFAGYGLRHQMPFLAPPPRRGRFPFSKWLRAPGRLMAGPGPASAGLPWAPALGLFEKRSQARRNLGGGSNRGCYRQGCYQSATSCPAERGCDASANAVADTARMAV